jgi:hypothetical protein
MCDVLSLSWALVFDGTFSKSRHQPELLNCALPLLLLLLMAGAAWQGAGASQEL